MGSAPGYGAEHLPPSTPSRQPASAGRHLGTEPMLYTGTAAGAFSPTPHTSLPRTTQEAFLLLLLHFNTLFTLPTKGTANVFLSVTHPGFRCSIEKQKSSKSSCKHQCFAALSSCPVGVTAANRNCKQRPNGNESGRQKGVKTK